MARICADDRLAQRRFGAENWSLLRRRLAVLAGAPTLADLEGAPGRCHALHGDRTGQFAMHLSGPTRLVFAPHGAVRTLTDGGLDRRSVTSIEVTEITDYHGD